MEFGFKFAAGVVLFFVVAVVAVVVVGRLIVGIVLVFAWAWAALSWLFGNKSAFDDLLDRPRGKSPAA